MFDGERYEHFDLRFSEQDQDVFINGKPVFNCSFEKAMTEEKCRARYGDIAFIEELVLAGMSCVEAHSRYRAAGDSCLAVIRRASNRDSQSKAAPRELEAAILRELGSSPFGAVVEKIEAKGGEVVEVTFVGQRAPIKVLLRSVGDFGFGGGQIDGAEAAFNSASAIRDGIAVPGYVESVFALRCGGGISITDRPGVVDEAKAQIARIRSSGKYVEGPIPRTQFHRNLEDR